MTTRIHKLRALIPEALSLLAVVWASAVWTVWTPGTLDRFGALKGTDFAQFYVAARLVISGRLGQLYDWSVFVSELVRSVPGPEGLLYLSIYPPQVALMTAPLGGLSYLAALRVWTFASVVAYALAGALLVLKLKPLRAELPSSVLLLAAFPAFPQLLLFGQASAFALALIALAWIAWRGDRPQIAGLLLGALLFKPQMLAVAGAACLLLSSWRLVAGVVAGALIEAGATVAIAGSSVAAAYAHVVRKILQNPAAFEPKAEQIQSLRGLVTVLGDGPAGTLAFLVLAAVAMAVAFRAVRREQSMDLRFAIAVLAGALVNPHLYVYDLVILMLPLGIVASWLLESTPAEGPSRRSAVAARLLYWLPLVAPVLGLLKVQLMAPAMLWLVWALGSDGSARPTASR